MWPWKLCNFCSVVFGLPLHTVAGFIGKCKPALLTFNFTWLLRMIFETPQSLLNHWVSRVLIKRGIFGGQLCVFVWLGGFWVVEEESYMPAAWAGLWAATLCYLGGQWGVMQKFITWALPWGVASKTAASCVFTTGVFQCFTEDESSSTVWL